MTTSPLHVDSTAGPAGLVDPLLGIDAVDRYVLAVRLLGYLGRHDDAAALASEALAVHPRSARLLRLRGEKRLLVHDFLGAEADLEAAVVALATEPDHQEYYRDDVERDVINLVVGRPGESSGPQVPGETEREDVTRSTLHAVAWHHLGIVRYLRGRFSAAADAFAESQLKSADDHIHLAAADWEYLSLRRAQRHVDAAACLLRLDGIDLSTRTPDGTDIPLSLTDSYRQRLRMYRGEVGPEVLLRNDSSGRLAVATLGHGVGTWYLIGGHPEAASRVWSRVLELGEPASSGYLAAEVEWSRLHAGTSSGDAADGSSGGDSTLSPRAHPRRKQDT